MGAGAIGSVVGGFMARAGHTVALIGRAPHMEAIARSGLRISGIWGDHRVTGMATHTTPDTVGPGPWDCIVVAVKSYDTEAAARAIAPLTGPDTVVCAYQNGLGNAEALADVLGWDRVVGVRAIYGVWLPEAGHATVTVIAQPTALGVYDNGQGANQERVRELAAAMDDAGLPTVFTERIATLLWQKVTYNCALNPMSALLDVPYGALAAEEATCSIMRDIVNEIYTVGQRMGVALDPDTPDDYYKLLVEALIPPTAAHYASMREDLRRGRRTEIGALNGAICRYAQQHGIHCPVNKTLVRLIETREILGMGSE